MTTAADRRAAHKLVGCQHPTFCPWAGVVIIQYMNAEGPKHRSCRGHAEQFRTDDNYAVRDTGRANWRVM